MLLPQRNHTIDFMGCVCSFTCFVWRSHCISQARFMLRFMVLFLPHPPKCCDYSIGTLANCHQLKKQSFQSLNTYITSQHTHFLFSCLKSTQWDTFAVAPNLLLHKKQINLHTVLGIHKYMHIAVVAGMKKYLAIFISI